MKPNEMLQFHRFLESDPAGFHMAITALMGTRQHLLDAHGVALDDIIDPLTMTDKRRVIRAHYDLHTPPNEG